MYRELFRCSYSLASAGNVCWAKPNHAFSYCQQLGRIFFRPRRRPGRGVGADADSIGRGQTTSRSAATESCFYQTAFFKGFAKRDALVRRCRHVHARCRRSDERAASRSPNETRRQVRTGAPVSRRTSRFARKCANFSGASHPRIAVVEVTLHCRRHGDRFACWRLLRRLARRRRRLSTAVRGDDQHSGRSRPSIAATTSVAMQAHLLITFPTHLGMSPAVRVTRCTAAMTIRRSGGLRPTRTSGAASALTASRRSWRGRTPHRPGTSTCARLVRADARQAATAQGLRHASESALRAALSNAGPGNATGRTRRPGRVRS